MVRVGAWTDRGGQIPGKQPAGSACMHAQEEKEQKKLRRKQSNRESARRSRLRKQAETEGLAKTCKDLQTESAGLKQTVDALKVMVERLSADKITLINQVGSAAFKIIYILFARGGTF